MKSPELLIHLPLKNMSEYADMTDYVNKTLAWAMGRMTDLTLNDKSDDALAIGAEFIGWANESDKEIICSCVQPEGYHE